MMKDRITYDVTVLMNLSPDWEANGNDVVKEYIHYENGTNNWCPEDLACFEKQLSASNPNYLTVVNELQTNGYPNLSKKELGTLWVIMCGITNELVNIGPADTFGKVPANSSNQLFIDEERKSVKKARRKQLKAANTKRDQRGPKGNHYRAAYDKYVIQLLPWLRTIPSIKDEKGALTLIGLVLYLAGHYELKGQYLEVAPTKKTYEKKVEQRVEKTIAKYDPISFTDYLWNRMKAVYYDFLKFAA